MNIQRMIMLSLLSGMTTLAGTLVSGVYVSANSSPPTQLSEAKNDSTTPVPPCHGGHSLVGKVIVVDAGHGGPDGGARSANGLLEKDVALAISRRLSWYLREGGAIVYMTRDSDRDLADDSDRRARRRHQGDLRNRLHSVLSKHPDAFISVHCNASPSPAWSGSTTIYMKGNDQGERLARLIQEEFRRNLLPTHRSADDMDSLYLLKRITGPAALAEVGFLSNTDEAEHLRMAAYQDKIAFSLYLATVHYFVDPPVQTTPPVASKHSNQPR